MFEVGSGIRELNAAVAEFEGKALETALGTRILRRSVTVWQEHCSECAMPGCYASCSFYTPRNDFKCRRFPGGITVLPSTAFAAAPMRLQFGKWARLLGYGPGPLESVDAACRKERREVKLAKRADSLVTLRGVTAPFLRRRVNSLSSSHPWGRPDTEGLYLVVEAFNASPAEISLSLDCRVLSEDGGAPGRPFEAKLSFPPGYAVRAVPVAAFVDVADVGRRFSMQIAPSNHDEHPQITFGLLDIAELSSAPRDAVLVTSRPRAATPTAPKIKCVIWDLDNTLWDGTLIEDDIAGLRLRPEAVQAVQELDRKGILQSVVSKNDLDVAQGALEHFGLGQYFLFPQISWGPKSHAIQALAQRLNISSDTFVFVDDQEFEREEVLSQHPEVLVWDSAVLGGLLTHERLQVEVTSEAAMRRRLYQEEEQRSAALAASSGAYEEFLRSCEMRVEIGPLQEPDAVRAHELAQRTNQLNIWSSRYTLDEVRKLLADDSPLRGFTVRASDRFGSYGLVGLCVLDDREGLVRDLMFSCRIQGKLVGEAFMAWLAARNEPRGNPLRARYKPTRKNGPAKALLEATGFTQAGILEEGELWAQTGSYRTMAEIEQIVHVTAPAAPGTAASVQAL